MEQKRLFQLDGNLAGCNHPANFTNPAPQALSG